MDWCFAHIGTKKKKSAVIVLDDHVGQTAGSRQPVQVGLDGSLLHLRVRIVQGIHQQVHLFLGDETTGHHGLAEHDATQTKPKENESEVLQHLIPFYWLVENVVLGDSAIFGKKQYYKLASPSNLRVSPATWLVMNHHHIIPSRPQRQTMVYQKPPRNVLGPASKFPSTAPGISELEDQAFAGNSAANRNMRVFLQWGVPPNSQNIHTHIYIYIYWVDVPI